MNQKFLLISSLLTEVANKHTKDFKVGDTLLVGRWKNSPAIVKGFGKDKRGQPTVKTTKGPFNLYRFRIQKMMKDAPKEVDLIKKK